MQHPGRLPLSGDRWTPLARVLRFNGVDLTGAEFRAQVRLYPDAPGDPLVDLRTAGPGVEGVRLVAVESVAGKPVSTVLVSIGEAAMGNLPGAAAAGGEAGEDAALHWDLVITWSGTKQRWLYGPFIVRAGVTR